MPTAILAEATHHVFGWENYTSHQRLCKSLNFRNEKQSFNPKITQFVGGKNFCALSVQLFTSTNLKIHAIAHI